MTRRTASVLLAAALLTGAGLRAGALRWPESVGRQVALSGFVDEHGRPFRAAPRDRRPLVLVPMYARCPTTCSALTANVLTALRASGLRRSEYRIASFSFDPSEQDAALTEFRRRLRLPGYWQTLRAADPGALRDLLDGLDFQVLQLDSGGFQHPSRIIVLDADLRLVDSRSGLDIAPQVLAAAVRSAADGESAVRSTSSVAWLLVAVAFVLSCVAFAQAVLWARRRAGMRRLGMLSHG